MTGAVETEDAGGQVQRAAGAVAPVDGDRVAVKRTRVDERAAEGGGVVLVDGGSAECHLQAGGRNIVDQQARAAAAGAAVIVGHRCRDGVGSGSSRFVEVLMVDTGKTEHVGTQIQTAGAAVAPMS